MAAPRKTWKEMHNENARGNGATRSGAVAGSARLNDPWASVTGPRAGQPEVPRVVASGIDLPQSAPSRGDATAAKKTADTLRSKAKAKAKTKPKARLKSKARGTKPNAQVSTRSRSESLLVSSLVATFCLVAVAVASVTVRGNMQTERSRVAVQGTLAQVHERQATFRVINQRFASWPELEAMGLKVPEGQRVVRSNATVSHWFVAVRDENTGVTCSRTGELFDDSSVEREPSCTSVVR